MKRLGSAPSWHRSMADVYISHYRRGVGRVYGSCADRLKKLRNIERELQIARVHAVGAENWKRQAATHRLQKQLQKQWRDFSKSCVRS